MKTITLKTDLISAEIPLPGEAYARSRYDWSGIVSQVRLGGRHTFLSTEYPDPKKGGGGLGLIGIFDSDDNLEYDKTELADRFPLMGAGLLKRPDMNAYCFINDYNVLPFLREWDYDASSAVFTTFPMLCNGYAMRQVKTIALKGSSLTITNTLTNEGEKPLNIREVNHNFLQFDSHPIDGSTVLTFPYNLNPKIRRGVLSVGFNTLALSSFDPLSRTAAVAVYGYQGLSAHHLQIENHETQTGLTISEDFPVSRVYIFMSESAIAPEMFCSMNISPGDGFTYNRTYRFYEL